MGHALFHPHSPGTLSASPGPISHTGTSALGEAREPQDVRARRASPQCPADGTWTREQAGPRPWWWSWYLGRVGGLAARGAVPRCGATSSLVSHGSAPGAAEIAGFVQPQTCLGTS